MWLFLFEEEISGNNSDYFIKIENYETDTDYR